jgi:hypothetical protein
VLGCQACTQCVTAAPVERYYRFCYQGVYTAVALQGTAVSGVLVLCCNFLHRGDAQVVAAVLIADKNCGASHPVELKSDPVLVATATC